MSNVNEEQKEKLLQLVRESVQQDKQLREQFQIGEKFRFIRDRLNALMAHVEEGLATLQKASEKSSDEITEDEVYVYVHLFNSHGLVFKTWQKMLNPSVFYEYSVNRPVYTDKSQIEAFVRGKPNKAQHGFLTIIVKKQDILPAVPGAELPKDTMGHSLVKVKEGSLLFKKLVSFNHNGHDYIVSEAGELIKKNE